MQTVHKIISKETELDRSMSIAYSIVNGIMDQVNKFGTLELGQARLRAITQVKCFDAIIQIYSSITLHEKNEGSLVSRNLQTKVSYVSQNHLKMTD